MKIVQVPVQEWLIPFTGFAGQRALFKIAANCTSQWNIALLIGFDKVPYCDDFYQSRDSLKPLYANDSFWLHESCGHWPYHRIGLYVVRKTQHRFDSIRFGDWINWFLQYGTVEKEKQHVKWFCDPILCIVAASFVCLFRCGASLCGSYEPVELSF